LSYGARSFTSTQSELGLRFDTRLAVTEGSILLLRGRLAWRHEFSGSPTLNASFDNLPSPAFVVNGTALPRDALIASLGSEWRFTNGWSLGAKFSGEFSGRSQTYGGSGTMRY
ncbi:autotransporter outer membrane beta-barrel domain-containing protein, partial [Klebsiella pneumoniae]|uniref:autotransporter outer membrane beta-barrel domain-containing protein n=1 Tax=Klebsiella pneumoniae TaxID=573 RepID=UPI0013D46EF6